MLTAQELGWLVVVSCMVLGITFCLGVCLALWCRKLSGGRQMSPVTVLDPSSKENGLLPTKASLLLPSVTRSEFGSEPRTLSSSTTHLSNYQTPHWSAGGMVPRPYPPTHTSRFTDPLLQEPMMRGVYLPFPYRHDLPPKYATVYSASSSDAHRDHMAQLTAHWARSRQDEQLDAKVPMVPTTLTYMPQPRSDQPTSPVSSGNALHQFGLESESDKEVGNGSVVGLRPATARGRLGSERESSGCESSPNAEVSGIDGRRQLVSGLGYNDPELMNSYDDDGVVLSNYRSRPSVKKRKAPTRQQPLKRQSRSKHTPAKVDFPDSKSPILGGKTLRSQYGADCYTEITLSTGVNVGHVPIVTGSAGMVQSRENSSTRKFNESVHRSSTGSANVMENLGIATNVQNEPTVKELLAAKMKVNRQGRGNSKTSSGGVIRDCEAGGLGHPSDRAIVPLMQVGPGGLDGRAAADSLGSLGGIEVKVKYQAVQQQLIMTIISALHLPTRFHSSESKLYIKILIGTGTRYTTPAVPGTPHPSFCCTLVHRVHSTRLQRTHIRLSVCQLDPQNRRIVVGFASLSPPNLWPLLHLPPAPLTHDLSPRHLLLALQDTAPQHQLDCGGNVTLGLSCDQRSGRITVASVTLQDVRSTSGLIDFGHSQVYLKATVFRGREMICWRRSSPVVLNRQRTHLVHQLLLRVHVSLDGAIGAMPSSGEQSCSGQTVTPQIIAHDTSPSRATTQDELKNVSSDSPPQDEQPYCLVLQEDQQTKSCGYEGHDDFLEDSIAVHGQRDGESSPQSSVSGSSGLLTEEATRKKSKSKKVKSKSSKTNSKKQPPGKIKDDISQDSDLTEKSSGKSGDVKARVSSSIETPSAQKRDHHETGSSDESLSILCGGMYPCLETKKQTIEFDLEENVGGAQRKKKEASDSMLEDGQTSLTEYIDSIFENKLHEEWKDLPTDESFQIDEPKMDGSKLVKKNVDLPFSETVYSGNESDSVPDSVTAQYILNPVTDELSSLKLQPTVYATCQSDADQGAKARHISEETSGYDDAPLSNVNELHDKVEPGTAALPEGATVARPTRAKLQQQASTEDEAPNDAVLLVLSVRLKTPKRGGRCVLGTVQLGEMANTERGRSHWRRALASTLVPAAGTHELCHL